MLRYANDFAFDKMCISKGQPFQDQLYMFAWQRDMNKNDKNVCKTKKHYYVK